MVACIRAFPVKRGPAFPAYASALRLFVDMVKQQRARELSRFKQRAIHRGQLRRIIARIIRIIKARNPHIIRHMNAQMVECDQRGNRHGVVRADDRLRERQVGVAEGFHRIASILSTEGTGINPILLDRNPVLFEHPPIGLQAHAAVRIVRRTGDIVHIPDMVLCYEMLHHLFHGHFIVDAYVIEAGKIIVHAYGWYPRMPALFHNFLHTEASAMVLVSKIAPSNKRKFARRKILNSPMHAFGCQECRQMHEMGNINMMFLPQKLCIPR